MNWETVAPKFVQLTNDVVFDDLWRRSDLSVRDRSLVTIAALAAMGDDDQLDVYVRRGLESGMTRGQITEALTHLGFYAGWPKATRATSADGRRSASRCRGSRLSCASGRLPQGAFLWACPGPSIVTALPRVPRGCSDR